MHTEYIEQRDGGFYVAGTRISLDSVVYAFNRGESPEQILENFPLLEKLSRVYGAIAFYLDHKSQIDQLLEETAIEMETAGIPLQQANPALWEKIQRARVRIGERSM